VGLGYWGPNLARNFQTSADFDLVGLCDQDPRRVERAGAPYPSATQTTDIAELLEKATPDLVAIATPVASHVPLSKAALEFGAHVLCEKPIARSVREAEELLALARKQRLHLFVDHPFKYTGAVRVVQQLYATGALGNLFYIDSVRINLGLFQPDVDVTWDLAPHDLSILSYVLGGKNVTHVRATGSTHNPHGFIDVAYVDLEYKGGLTAHLHLSWLSPVKVRRMIFSGSRSSCIYDDVEASEKVRIYDHGVSFEVDDVEQRRQVLVSYRRGEMRAPAVDLREALAAELTQIAAHIRGAPSGASLGDEGLEIVRILAACETSLAKDGARVAL
jgi:predicted dehydrogenase